MDRTRMNISPLPWWEGAKGKGAFSTQALFALGLIPTGQRLHPVARVGARG